MKLYETHFEEYITSSNSKSLHPSLQKIYNNFPEKLVDFKNLIFYGSKGVGKYTQILCAIQNYSPSKLKYEKKFIVHFNKQSFMFKISDIHYEIDMSLLGCNSKLLWNEIFSQIVNIISSKQGDNMGIIVCKYFHEIHSELLENFYSYMQNNIYSCVDLKFILITEQVSFIPDNILNACEIIHVPRPSKSSYNKCLLTNIASNTKLHEITNIKNLHTSDKFVINPYKKICDKIIYSMINIKDFKFLSMRDLLYDILIYNLEITECIWYILDKLIEQQRLRETAVSDVLIKTYTFLQYYNNNYRPIYHLESYIIYLINTIHELPKST